jgi:ATPase subunit of ABC transporter with duplicated ATPase domains
VSGKDAVGGRLIGQMQGRMKHEQEKLSQLRTKKEYRLGISLPGARSHRNELLQIPAGSILLGGQKWLEHPDLYILPSDRIALVGPNGSGKSTLVSRIFPSLKIPPENITYIPQETDADQSRQILAQVREAPPAKLGQLMTLISRLGSRPQPLLESAIPSPGETRKLLLAMGMANEPQIIIMDEPTNHMDLPSIECLEEALSEVSCALLLVSHDRRFLEKLTTVRWNIRRVLEDKERCVLQIT